ncbi:MAG: B12-binding domain-containing protein, partial [Acidobacteriota bacterium]
MHDLSQLARSLEQGQVEQATAETQKAIEAGVPTKTILDEGLIAGMTIVGEKFKAHEIFLPDVLLAAKAMYAGLGLLEPLMVDAGIPPRGRVILGTVRGDLHDIGKNLVGIMLRGAGFEVIDLGKDVAPERYVDEAERSGADVV